MATPFISGITRHAVSLCSDRARLCALLGLDRWSLASYGQTFLLDGVAFELLSQYAAALRRTRKRLLVRCPECGRSMSTGYLARHVQHHAALDLGKHGAHIDSRTVHLRVVLTTGDRSCPRNSTK
jgi:hypothetical protein